MVIPELGAEAIALQGRTNGGRAAHPTAWARRPCAPGAHAHVDLAAAGERYIAELHGRLDELHEMLSFAERRLELDAGGRTGAAGRPGTRGRPEAAVRLARQQWLAAVRKLDGLVDAGASRSLPLLNALGRETGLLRVGPRTIRLSRRQTEFMTLLAGHPRGMTTDALALALYGDPGRPASVRTLLYRVRKAVAPWIHSERGWVRLEIEADFLVVQRLLRAGLTRDAARRYAATLLPSSDAPGIVEARNELDTWVRSAVMASGDPEALWAWLGSASGRDDALAWKRFAVDVDFLDPRRSLAASRIAGLGDSRALVA
jgi:hypothetical protein